MQINQRLRLWKRALWILTLGFMVFQRVLVAGEIDITQWQLFLDDFVVARCTGFDRVIHHPKPMGLVIPADKPWETFGTAPEFVARKADGTFVAFYKCYWWDTVPKARVDHDRAHDFKTQTGYATSKDGIHWEKPSLGLVEAPAETDWEKFPPFPSPKGMSKENNLGVPFTIWDLGQYGNVSDPNKRYAVLYNGKAYFSNEIPDFINDNQWADKLVEAGGTFTPRGRIISYWDSIHEEWVGIVQNAVPHWLPAREVARFASKDLVSWRSEIVLAPDSLDPHTRQRYDEPMGMRPFYANGVVLGLLSWFHSDRTHPDGGPILQKSSDHPYIWPWARKGINEMRITISRDGGKTWDRSSSREAWIPHGTTENAYDRCVIGPHPPIYVGDEDWFYMNVMDGDHLVIRNSPEQMPYYKDRVVKHQTALYIQKHNRYVSFRAYNNKEVLITKPITLTGNSLELNVDATRGLVRVGIASADPVPTLNGTTLSTAPHLGEQQPLAGFRFEDCQPIQSDSVAYKVQFKNGTGIESLNGKRVRLLFEVTDADVFGFRSL